MFILDTCRDVFVWIGNATSSNEKKNAMVYAHVRIFLFLLSLKFPFYIHPVFYLSFKKYIVSVLLYGVEQDEVFNYLLCMFLPQYNIIYFYIVELSNENTTSFGTNHMHRRGQSFT